jgi:hypothetical protein
MAWVEALLAGMFAVVSAPSAIVVTEDDAALPQGCRPAQIARIVKARDPRLTQVIVGYANGLGQIEFRLGPRIIGKGAVDCREGRIVAWGAGPSPEAFASVCRAPAATTAVLACVRHWG